MRTLRIGAIAFAVLAIQGCVLLGPATYSKPHLPSESGHRLEEHNLGYQYVLSLPELELFASPRNASPGWGLVGPWPLPVIPFPLQWDGTDHSGRPFVFDLHLYPAGQQLLIDIAQITLETDDGRRFTPIGFIGPVEARVYWGHKQVPHYLRGRAGICGEKTDGWGAAELEELPLQEPQSPIAFAEDICLGLLFDVPTPSPDHKFTLSIGGISKAGAAVSVPQIHFERARGWEYDEIP